MSFVSRLRTLLPALWAGWMLSVAAVGTSSAFALLQGPDAGRLVGRMLAIEAYTALGFGVTLLVLERLSARHAVSAGQGSQFSLGMVLALAALFCTIAGYFALLPMMDAARAGQGPLSFGQLHAISAGCFGLKIILVLVLAWRNAASQNGATPAPATSLSRQRAS